MSCKRVFVPVKHTQYKQNTSNWFYQRGCWRTDALPLKRFQRTLKPWLSQSAAGTARAAEYKQHQLHKLALKGGGTPAKSVSSNPEISITKSTNKIHILTSSHQVHPNTPVFIQYNQNSSNIRIIHCVISPTVVLVLGLVIVLYFNLLQFHERQQEKKTDAKKNFLPVSNYVKLYDVSQHALFNCAALFFPDWLFNFMFFFIIE